MLLRYFYDDKLAHASYMVGCQKKGEVVIVDPMRNITPYIEVAKKENMRIVGSLETHIHADFVTGSRELAEQFDAVMYVSDEGGQDWEYANLKNVPHKLLKDGDKFNIGHLKFEVMHTPGHTPESISFLLTDGLIANKPIGIFTGDFVFVGDVGRPDLLEKAVGMVGTADAGARSMYKSIERFKLLPDYLQIWPTHGAGSACGKALGAIPSSTVGYEKLFNWALKCDNEEEFVNILLDGQPEPPYYFKVMKTVNRIGIQRLKDVPKIKKITSEVELQEILNVGHLVIDIREAKSFSECHLKGTINVPFNKMFTTWLGWIVDFEKPLYLLMDDDSMLDEILIALHSIGIDLVLGYAVTEEMFNSNLELHEYESVNAERAQEMLDKENAEIIDVRNFTEFKDGHIEGAHHIMLGTLKNRLDELPNKKLIIQCQSGVRSAIGVSILKANGIHDVVNLVGGYVGWKHTVR